MPTTCAFGCEFNPDVPLHRLPNVNRFPDRFQVWVSLLGGKLETAADYEAFKNKRVCDIHFIDAHKNRNRRLNALAVPSLHLPGTSIAIKEATTHEPKVADVPENSASDSTSGNAANASPSTTSGAKLTGLRKPRIELEHNYFTPGFSTQRTTANSTSRSVTLTTVPALATTSSSGKAMGRSQMQPRFKCIQSREVKTLRSEVCRLRKKAKIFEEQLKSATKISKDLSFQTVTKNMTKPAQIFMHMQLQTKKKAKGRRYTLQEKILSLSLYKKSPKAYRLLCSLFSLPSAKSMRRLLSKIKITPGINPIVFEKIKKSMEEMDRPERLCSLIFDEVSLTAQISYNAQKDELQGFANNKPNMFANHALVFMVKGVKNNFKQPIAYYFTNSLNKLELKQLIKTVCEHAIKSGLIIVNTVCDQSTVNVGAVTDLVQETRALYLRKGKQWDRNDQFYVAGHTIIPMYDVPHLIKGLRNNLLTKDLIYETSNGMKKVKWEFFQMVSKADEAHGELRLLNKLTEEHLNPEKIPKMRVKFATQVFSHSMAVVTEHLSARGLVPEECKQLIEFTLLVDNLFDSLNGSTLTNAPNGKIFKGPVRRNSCHHELWEKAKKVLKTVKYIKKIKDNDKVRFVETVVPTTNNFIKTIDAMQDLWKVLSQKYGFDALLTRNFNQDPIENFFGNIRSYGARNIAPNSVAFEGAYKALMLNNYSAPHSSTSNCEEDSNVCLKTYEFFLTEETSEVAKDISKTIEFNEEICVDLQKNIDPGQKNYVCGWVIKKCLTNIKGCGRCKTNLLDASGSNPRNAFIRAKDYQKKGWLCEPNEDTENCFEQIQKLTINTLKKNVPHKGLKAKIAMLADILVDFPFTCTKHKNDLKNHFLNVTVNVLIYSWCRTVNRILAGQITYHGEDETKVAAQNYYNKYKNYKNRK